MERWQKAALGSLLGPAGTAAGYYSDEIGNFLGDVNENVDWGAGLSTGLQAASTGAMIGSAFGPVGTAIGAGVGGLGGLVYGAFTGGQERKQFEDNKRRQEQMFMQQQALAEANRAQANRLAMQQMNANMGATAQNYAKQQTQLRSNLASRGLLGTGGEAAAQGAFAGQRAQSLAAQQQAAQVQQAQADMVARQQAGMISANAEQARLQNEQAWNQRNQALFNNALNAVGGLGLAAVKNPALAKNLGEAGDIVSKGLQPYIADTAKGLGVGAQQVGAALQDTAKGLGVGVQQLGNMFQQTQAAPVNPRGAVMEVEDQPFNIQSSPAVSPGTGDDIFGARTRDDILDEIGATAATGEGLGPTFATPQQRVTFELKNLLGVDTSPSWQQEMATMDPGTYRRRLAELRSKPGLRLEYKNGRPVVVDNAAVADRFSAAYKYFNPYDISN